MPNLDSERKLEDYIRREILDSISKSSQELKVLENKKAVDILIVRDGESPRLFLIEVKFHKAKHGRLGIGSGKGKGFQPEIVNGQFSYFEQHLRWVLGHEEHTGKYWFVDTATIRKYVSGGKTDKKFNNIQNKFFKIEQPINAEALKDAMSSWLRHS